MALKSQMTLLRRSRGGWPDGAVSMPMQSAVWDGKVHPEFAWECAGSWAFGTICLF